MKTIFCFCLECFDAADRVTGWVFGV